MRGIISLVAGIVILGWASGADALCIYSGEHFEKSTSPDFDGRLYAKTTLDDEFIDSALVIRGTVSSRHSIGLPDDPNGWGTAYQVRVDQAFKGVVPKVILYVTNRDSGGFYLGEGGEQPEISPFLEPH